MFLKRLGKRGVAMTEYAILLAFVAAVAGSFTSDNGLASSIKGAVGKAENAINLVMGKQSQNKVYDVKMADDSLGYEGLVSGTVNSIFDIMGDDLALASSVYVKYDSKEILFLLPIGIMIL